MPTSETAWAELRAHVAEIETLTSAFGTLGWDEQTHMPPNAAPLRGAQLGLIARLAHDRVADPRVEAWLGALDSSDPVQAACQRNLGRAHRRERRVPAELVERLARARTAGFQAWLGAKQRADFSLFAPALEELVALHRERARAIDPSSHPYDVMLAEIDPGTTVAELRALFSRLRDGLVPLLGAISRRPPLARHPVALDLERQWPLNRRVAEALGYDFAAGRLDHAEHPFTSGHGPGDVRITTHLYPEDALLGLYSTIHEVGHALYELGLPDEHAGTTVREAASAGLHESQSRFWENAIGRSPAFASWLVAELREILPPSDVPTAEQIVAAQNRVEPGLIRIRADEVTYNLHIIVRFELEVALFEGTLSVAELPAAWNERYAASLGLTPANDAEGVLQDAHWSDGSFGYFPSYTLGNLYAASLTAQIGAERADFWPNVAAGRFGPILEWLRAHIHRRGHLVDAPDIIRAAVGERDHVADLLDHLWTRHGSMHGLSRP